MAQLWWALTDSTRKRWKDINEELWRNTWRINSHIICHGLFVRESAYSSATSLSWTEEHSTDRIFYSAGFMLGCSASNSFLWSFKIATTDVNWPQNCSFFFSIQITQKELEEEISMQHKITSFYFYAIRPRFSFFKGNPLEAFVTHIKKSLLNMLRAASDSLRDHLICWTMYV